MTTVSVIQDPYVRRLSDTVAETELYVPTMHCAACIAKVERGLPARQEADNNP